MLLAIPVTGMLLGNGQLELFFVGLDAFGFLSGFVALGLIARWRWYLTWSRPRQQNVATLTWAVHLPAFAGMILYLWNFA